MKLNEARKKINKVDREIAQLYEERMAAVKKVIAYKVENGLAVFDPKREAEMLNKNLEYLKEDSLKPFYKDFLSKTMENSKAYQNSLLTKGVVGFQGTEGAFSYLALKKMYPNNQIKKYNTFEAAIIGVNKGEVETAVIPFENSYTGEVGEVLDLLFKYDLKINAMFSINIKQNLLAIKGTKIENIKKVYSHHQALHQSEKFLADYQFELIPYGNTALSAKLVEEKNDYTIAAIGSKETAEVHNLEILVSNINTSDDNQTKFIVLKKERRESASKFSLIFTVDDDSESGGLVDILHLIAKHGFSLNNIKSRSVKGIAWGYYFYTEVEGDISTTEAKKMLEKLKAKCAMVKVIGVYDLL